jgi:GrpB-like predicted nucleotidyltransferase (UPF0157 family)
MRNIRVVPYDPSWPAAFEAEAARLTGILGDELVVIHHIGSTAVPGLAAKPVIDMMPLVRDIERVDLYNAAMIEAGYQPWGEYGIPGRRFFTRGGDEHRTHNIHVFQVDGAEVARHLDLRDYLRTHPAEAQRYAELKAALAAQFPQDIEGYMDGKDAFVKAMERRAGEWRAGLTSGRSPESG